jgi:hypothetical protein
VPGVGDARHKSKAAGRRRLRRLERKRRLGGARSLHGEGGGGPRLDAGGRSPEEHMQPAEYWKNFNLGEEIGIAGTFIYNGIRRFHEIRALEFTDEIFEVLYNLSVGLERLLKVAVVLLEHEATTDQQGLEESLITHSHSELLRRVLKRRRSLKLSAVHREFLQLLTEFYKSFRYDRFSLQSVYDPKKERDALREFLGKHLSVDLRSRSSFVGTSNEDRYRHFMRRLVIKISSALYQVISDRARELNLYTYELRYASKAYTVFLGKADIPAEETLWKELLVFFMNTKETSGYLTFLRGIEPLKFDPALVEDYLECFKSDAGASEVVDELEVLYEDVPDKKERLEKMNVIGAHGLHFPEDDDEGDDFEPLDENDG